MTNLYGGDGQGRDTDEGGTEHLPLNDVDEMDENGDVQVIPFKKTEDIDRVADMGSNLNYKQVRKFKGDIDKF